MKIPGLSQEIIEANAETGSVSRGREYFESGAVKSLRRRTDDEIEAYVQGSDIAPYRVDIKHDDKGIVSAECSCPYVGGAWCRHIAAVLFTLLESDTGEAVSLGQMLDEFDRVELIHLIERLAETYSGLVDQVEDAYRHKTGG